MVVRPTDSRPTGISRPTFAKLAAQRYPALMAKRAVCVDRETIRVRDALKHRALGRFRVIRCVIDLTATGDTKDSGVAAAVVPDEISISLA